MKATVLSAILSVGFYGAALGQDRPAPPPRGGGGPGPISPEMVDRAFGHLDANHDGEIDKTEFERHFPEMIQRIREHRMRDGFGDGPGGPPPPGAGQRGPRPGHGPGEGRDARRPGPPPAPFGAKPPLAGPRAERPDRPARSERPERGRGGPEGRQGRGEGAPGGPGFVVLGVLDANHDRTIDKEELKNASAALAKLDGNGDGEITSDELREAAKKQRDERSANGADGEKKKPGKGKKANKKKPAEG